MLQRPPKPDTVLNRVRARLARGTGEAIQWGWEKAADLAAIGPRSRRGKRFGAFGAGSIVCFPWISLFNERYIHVGAATVIGPHITLSALMHPQQTPVRDPVVRIGDRCLIGKGSGIVGHFAIDIGDDVWTGHYVYITDQNHGYEDVALPISRQFGVERAVSIGDGSWLGHGTVVLPGATIGRHVAVAAGSVVTGELPDFCVAAGAPARPVRKWDGTGWPRL